MFRIHNLRLGHATNSSSSHSIVIVPPGESVNTFDYDGGLEFGWEQFCLADPQSKARYFAAQVYFPLSEAVGEGVAAAAIRDWLGVDVHEGVDPDSSDMWKRFPHISVDHQSALSLTPAMLTPDFMKQLREFVENDRVVVYGGNDNGGDMEYPETYKQVEWMERITDNGRQDVRIRQDGKFWVMYNKNTGSKIRFSMDLDDTRAESYNKSTYPELVDVKITNKCSYGCEFCYQSSTPNGLHADWSNIQRIFNKLQDWGVFEVAIGGGEPTEHPDFADILEICWEDHEITPNFTTFGVKWLKDIRKVEAVKKYAGGIGVSVHSVRDLSKVQKIAEAINGSADNLGSGWQNPNSVSILPQHVVGTCAMDDTIELINHCWHNNYPILLLGYKDVGFGFDYRTNTTEGMDMAIKLTLDRAQKKGYGVSLSVDTAFVDQYPELIDLLGINRILTSSPEGKFSMYWDAVENKIGPSSYCDPGKMVTLEDKWQTVDFLEIYRSF